MHSIPIAYSVILRETYENLEFILDRIKYNEHEWQICVDLKVVAILNGCKLATLNICAFCVDGTAVRDQNTTCAHYGHHEIHLHLDPIMLFTKH